MTVEADLKAATARLPDLLQNLERAIFGKPEAVRLAVVGLLSEGHLLLEDVPGTGKTTLARALGALGRRRVPAHPVHLGHVAGDVLGLSVHDPAAGGFRFQPGPIFANIVLADELNRTPPRTSRRCSSA